MAHWPENEKKFQQAMRENIPDVNVVAAVPVQRNPFNVTESNMSVFVHLSLPQANQAWTVIKEAAKEHDIDLSRSERTISADDRELRFRCPSNIEINYADLDRFMDEDEEDRDDE